MPTAQEFIASASDILNRYPALTSLTLAEYLQAVYDAGTGDQALPAFDVPLPTDDHAD